jgi:hypothetical protein
LYISPTRLDILTYSFAGTVLGNIIEKCKGCVNDFLALRSLVRKGFDSVTPYMHCLVYHVPFFTKKYGKLLRFSGQGLEKINDDIKKNHHSKTNKQTNNLSVVYMYLCIVYIISHLLEEMYENQILILLKCHVLP